MVDNKILTDLLNSINIKTEVIDLCHSKETRSEAAIRRWQEGRYEKAIAERKGYKHSEESKLKMSEAKKHRKFNITHHEALSNAAKRKQQLLRDIQKEYKCSYSDAMLILYPKRF